MVGLTFSSSSVNGVVNDNNYRYKSMVMNAMRMNYGYIGECSIIHEELSAEAVRFFELLHDSDEPIWDKCKNHSKLLVVAQVFTFKSNNELSEVDYDRIVE